MRRPHRTREIAQRGTVGDLRRAICAIAVGSSLAAAQPSESIAQAEQLFEQARALATAGDYAAACPMFEASYKLDPALGTLLNMATCYENAGKLASAWGRYREVISVATKVNDQARIAIAREKSAALEPRLPKLTIRGPATTIPGLVVLRDDVPVDPAVLGAGIYVDPGQHVVSANAPKHRAVSIEVTMIEAETKIVEVPALERLPEPPAPAATATAMQPIYVELDPGKSRRITGIVFGATGAAAIATGLGFGVAARSRWNSAFDDGLCNEDTNQCTKEGQERTSDARRHALVANVVTGIGVAMVAAGAVLYFTAPKKRRAEVTVAPVAGGAAVSIGGAW